MIYLLTIGYRTYALPSNRGLQTVIDTMSRAQMVEEDNRYEKRGFKLADEPVKCRIETLPGYAFSKRGDNRSDVLVPEVLPPERSMAARVGVARGLALMAPQIDAKTRRMIEGGVA
jgi:hypothetical protein